MLSLCRAWELKQRIATDDWLVRAAATPGNCLLAYAGYALARCRPLADTEGAETEGGAEDNKSRVEQLLGKKAGRRGSLAHHSGPTLKRTTRPGGDKAGRTREYVVKRARLAELHEADTPTAAQ